MGLIVPSAIFADNPSENVLNSSGLIVGGNSSCMLFALIIGLSHCGRAFFVYGFDPMSLPTSDRVPFLMASRSFAKDGYMAIAASLNLVKISISVIAD